jgi:leader peptidase (prepilin peptidase)/N-methyltransferase
VASGLAAAVLVPAALIDVHHRRLPNRWVAAAALTFVAAVLIGLGFGDGSDVGGAGLGMIALAGPLLVLHLVSPTSMGFGDVKAAAVLGACLGAIDWQLALAGLALAAGLTSVVAIVRHRSVVAFGPGLVAGALIALAAHSILLDTPDRSSSETGTALERPTNGEQPT